MFKKLVFERHSRNAGSDKIIVAQDKDEVFIKRTASTPGNSTTKIVAVPAEDFLNELNKISITEWEDDYWVPVMDGESWSLKYYTTDGNKKSVTGSNAYPEEYDALIDLLFSDGEEIFEITKTVTISLKIYDDDDECEDELKNELEDTGIEFEDFLDADDEEKAEMLEFAGLDIEEYRQYFDDEDFELD